MHLGSQGQLCHPGCRQHKEEEAESQPPRDRTHKMMRTTGGSTKTQLLSSKVRAYV